MGGKGQREVITAEVKVQGDKGSAWGSHDDLVSKWRERRRERESLMSFKDGESEKF